MSEKLEEGDQERDGKKITSDTSGRWERKKGRHYQMCITIQCVGECVRIHCTAFDRIQDGANSAPPIPKPNPR